MTEVLLNTVVAVNRIFFCYAHPVLQVLLHTNMSPETKYLVADHLLEPVYKTERNDHHSHTQGSGPNSEPDNKT